MRAIMGYFAGQVRQVLRRLSRTPMFTAVTLITLAVGVAANTVVFSVVEGILLKPLPFPQPERLVLLTVTAPGVNIKELQGAPSNYFIYREQGRSFEDVGMMSEATASITGTG